jgi:GNAT superfamily N-acetyltransferase
LTAPTYAIRHMTPAEIKLAVDWAAAEGWNPGLADDRAFQAADRNGFLVGLLDGEPIASISAVSYGGHFGFIGFYIVRPEWRGRGYGWRLWQAAMRQLEGQPAGLDGVVAQQENYRKSGFVLAHRNLRYGGEVVASAPPDPRVRPIGGELRAMIDAYDTLHFPVARPRFLNAWLDPTLRTCLAFVEGGGVRGYGVIRPSREGRKIGPLFADDELVAEALFQALAQSGDGPVFLDPPEPNAAARRLAERHGLKPAFETARMYLGPAPELPLSRIFGITTFELG